MGTISSGSLISGLDTQNLIDQLIQAQSGPQRIAQRRLVELQAQQAGFLDVNTAMNSLRDAAAAFRIDSSFEAKSATSSNEDVLTATAGITAQASNSTFIVDRLVTTQQSLSRGFADRDTSPLGAASFSFEGEEAKLDRDVSLTRLNDGNGFTRGSISITAAGSGQTATVDLSRAATVNDVIDAVAESNIGVTARVSGGRFVLENAASVTNAGTDEVVESLGLDTDTDAVPDRITGSTVFGLNGNTALTALNDGRGVLIGDTVDVGGSVSNDLTITVDDNGTAREVKINLGPVFQEGEDGAPEQIEGPVTSIDGVIQRIEDAAASVDGVGVDLSVSANRDTGALEFATGAGVSITSVDSVGSGTAAEDLGIDQVSTATSLGGRRVLAGLSSRLATSLNGGAGVGGDGQITFTDRSGASTTVTGLNTLGTVEEIIDTVNSATDAAGVGLALSLNDAGTGLLVTDTTGATAGELRVEGTAGDDTAASLGIATAGAGPDATTFRGSNLQLQYIGEATRLSELNNGAGVNQGTFEIRNGLGETAQITVNETDKTIDDILDRINNAFGGGAVTAQINATGDGIEIIDNTGGSVALRVQNITGDTASALRIAGEADDPSADNRVDGTFETTIEFDAADTLDDIVNKINDDGNSPVRVSVIDDGSSSNPFRLNIVSEQSGRDGRFVIDTNGFDLGLQTLDEGEDARVFFGASDPKNAVLLTSSSNTIDGVVPGVSIDLRAASDTPVTLTVSQDTASVEEDIGEFVSAFNNVLDRIDRQTRFDQETGERGALLGSSTIINLRQALSNAINGTAGFSGSFDRLSEVGIRVQNDEGGRIEFDAETFRDALSQDPQSVADLFTRRTIDPNAGTLEFDGGITVQNPNAGTTFSELGIIPNLEQEVDRYVDSISGILTRERNTLDTQIDSQQDRISSIQENLNAERERLQAEFAALERSLADLQSQQTAVSSLSGLG